MNTGQDALYWRRGTTRQGATPFIRAELDAYYTRLYGLIRHELRYILSPKDVYVEDFPRENIPFWIVKILGSGIPIQKLIDSQDFGSGI